MPEPILPYNNRVIVKVWMEEKNFHTFANGHKIKLERDYDNFNRRYTQISQGTVVSSKYIPIGATILMHHNSCHDTNRLFDYTSLSGEDIASEIRYYSIPEEMCYLWRCGEDEWQPLKNFATALRLFKPYKGILQNIEPTKIKNVLYIKTGEFTGKVVHTLHACDYEIIFQNEKGREERIVRCRHFEDYYNADREEIICINDELTEQVLNGELLVGIDISDAKPLSYYERYVKKYGNEDYARGLATYDIEQVKNQEFFWFEKNNND